MSNSQYVKGRRKEYKICKRLKEEGFDIVQRTAGSHSPIDVIAINKTLKTIKLIQSKPENYNSSKLEKEYRWLKDIFRIEFVVE